MRYKQNRLTHNVSSTYAHVIFGQVIVDVVVSELAASPALTVSHVPAIRVLLYPTFRRVCAVPSTRSDLHHLRALSGDRIGLLRSGRASSHWIC